MADEAFTLPAGTYLEIARALRPHVSRDKSRPALECVRIRHDGERVAMETTDSYSMVRAIAAVGHPLDVEPGGFDVLVTAKHALALKPARHDVVIFRRVGGFTEVSSGVMTLRLENYDGPLWPDLDQIAADYAGHPPVNIEHGIGMNPALLARLNGLPGAPAVLRFTSPLRPMFFTASGSADYEGVVMPVRLMDGQAARHKAWAA